MVNPSLNGITIPAEFCDRETSPPPIVDEEAHGRLLPMGITLLPVENNTEERIVAVSEDVGLHHNLLTDCSFYREPPTIDFGFDTLDDYTSSSILHSHDNEPLAEALPGFSILPPRE